MSILNATEPIKNPISYKTRKVGKIRCLAIDESWGNPSNGLNLNLHAFHVHTI